MGASFTATTVMPTVLVSDNAPPLPLLPRSLVLTVSVSLPKKLRLGVKRKPFNALLMSTSVPLNTIAALLLVPLANTKPALVDNNNVPLPTAKLTCNTLPPASGSLTTMALPFAALKNRLLSSLTVCGPGTVFTGAWLGSMLLAASEAENSEVSPLPLVAVAVMSSPGATNAFRLTVLLPLPKPSVTKLKLPKKRCPCGPPEGLLFGLAKYSMRKDAFAALFRLVVI